MRMMKHLIVRTLKWSTLKDSVDGMKLMLALIIYLLRRSSKSSFPNKIVFLTEISFCAKILVLGVIIYEIKKYRNK